MAAITEHLDNLLNVFKSKNNSLKILNYGLVTVIIILGYSHNAAPLKIIK